jgi:drug/metabolite transporter (DMT)-like permease
MTQDERVLDLLGIFHYVVGVLMILGASIFLIHLTMGIVFMTGDFPESGNPPPPIMGLIFVVLAAVAITVGWTLAGFIIAAGRSLRGRRKHGFCMVMAGIECIFMPFGTILGVFTLVTLMKEEVRLLFK